MVVGIYWGGGLDFNYLFIGVWMGDVTAWWWFGDAYIERRQVYWAIQGIFVFMIVRYGRCVSTTKRRPLSVITVR